MIHKHINIPPGKGYSTEEKKTNKLNKKTAITFEKDCDENKGFGAFPVSAYQQGVREGTMDRIFNF